MLVMLGALIPTYLLSRLFIFLLGKTPLKSINKILLGNGFSWIASAILYAYGSADGGEPQFLSGFITYLIPQLIWIVFDLVRLNKQTTKLNTTKE